MLFDNHFIYIFASYFVGLVGLVFYAAIVLRLNFKAKKTFKNLSNNNNKNA